MTEDFSKFPTLELRNWTSLDNANFVSNSCLAVLIVSVELLGLFDDFLELGVRHTVHVFNNDRLFHAGGLHDTDANF